MSLALAPRERLVVALDVPTGREAVRLAHQLKDKVGMLKVGLELFCAEGPDLVRELQASAPVFLDLKLHDIPNTVQRALEALLPLNVRLINIHAQGGPAMMEAAARTVRRHREAGGETRLLAVTVLTSLDDASLRRMGGVLDPAAQALKLAQLAQECGVDGVVCSPHEAAQIRSTCGEAFHRLTPGIRPKGSDAQDQARIMTPREAVEHGATWMVVGRPITQAMNPAQAAQDILDELGQD